MSSVVTEVRVKIELLDQDGLVMDTAEVLADPDEALIGEIETALDAMLENNSEE